MRLILYLCILFIVPGTLTAQHDKDDFCGTDKYNEELCKLHPEMVEGWERAADLNNFPQYDATRGDSVWIIPIVFHIIHMNGSENISAYNVEEMVRHINDDFNYRSPDTALVRDEFKALIADLNMEFRLARIDPDGNCTNGITRTYSIETEDAWNGVKDFIWWDNTKYLNVWVVKSIEGGWGGFATYPWWADSDPWSDGIVMRSDLVGRSSTLTHEIGHYLGLYHTFNNGCGSDNCSTSGDRICDTPPESEDHRGCDRSQNSCDNDSPDLLDMIENHMSYSNCNYMFTLDQKDRMDFYLQNIRFNLYAESNLIETGVQDSSGIDCKVVAEFSSDHTFICEGGTISFTNKSLYTNKPQFNWYFSGGNPFHSNEENPTVKYDTAGIYQVKLDVTNSLGTDTKTKEEYIAIYHPIGQETPSRESFESANFKTEFWLLDPPENYIQWSRTNKAYYTGQYCYYINNYQNLIFNKSFTFILPPIDLSGTNAPRLSYRYAYAKRSSETKDMLRVYVSYNCGQSWSLRLIKSANKLLTTIDSFNTSFVPLNTGLWSREDIDLSYYEGESNVLVKFEFTGNSGNNLYIDDINIGSPSGIENELENNKSVKVYPTPTEGVIRISFESNKASEMDVYIYDLLGNLIYHNKKETKAGYNEIKFNIENTPGIYNGIYLLKIKIDNHIYTKKIIIIR